MNLPSKKIGAGDINLEDIELFSAREELTRRGIYYIAGQIEEDSLIDMHQDILLKHLNPKWNDDIQIIVNSPGGLASEGWALIDLLDWIKMDVRTVAIGCCASMASMLASAGTPGKRIIAANTSLMIHGCSWGSFGRKADIAAVSQEMEREHEREIKFWIKNSKYSNRDEIEKYFLHGKNDQYFSAEEALEHGLFDHIAGK